MKDWIAIFKTGTHTDSNGNTKEWTEKELDHIVSSYDPQKHESPVVIGHPKDNAPAYGWVESLKREGEMLYMKMKDVVPAFADMVLQKMFKKRSISLYPDGTLRHVGWLGAAQPAVKGLPDFAFGDKGGLTIEFEETTPAQGATPPYQGGERGNNRKEEGTMSFWERLKKRLADAGISFSEIFGSETPPVLYTEADIKTKTDEAVASAVKVKEAEFSEKVTSLEDARKKKDAEFKAREDALNAKEAEGKKAAVASFCEDLKKKGILIPAMEKMGMGITEFMSQVASIETTIEFGEAGKKEKQTPIEFMQAFLAALPKAIEFGEVAGRDKDTGKGGNAEKRERLISDYCEKNKDASYKTAVIAVSKEHPDIFKEE